MWSLKVMKYENLYSKKIIEEGTFEDLQGTYEFSKNHDYDGEKDDFEREICYGNPRKELNYGK